MLPNESAIATVDDVQIIDVEVTVGGGHQNVWSSVGRR